MSDAGKLLMLLGLVLALIGAVFWALDRLGFRGVPGDIVYRGEHVRFYFPIVTCILLSIVLTAAMWLWRYFSNK